MNIKVAAQKTIISCDEEKAMDKFVIEALDQACIALHQEQCNAVNRLHSATAVETVLQLQKHISRMQASIHMHARALNNQR